MALATNSDDSSDGWLAEINTTPLVDVMLVLLIIFLLTVPVVNSSLQLKLPTQTAQQQDMSSDYIIVSIDARGGLMLNDSPAQNPQQLADLIEPYAKLDPRPALHLRADGGTPYSAIAPVMDMARGFGFEQVSLLTLPAATPQKTPSNQSSGRVQ